MAHVQRIAAIEPLGAFTSDAYTLTKDIDIKEPITEITVGFQATNHGTAPNVDANIARCLTKIEIVDGSEVLWGLSGPLAVAHACYQTGKMPRRFDREDASVASRIRIPIRFGNFTGDEEKAFHARAFTNPQIKVTWNLAAITAVGANSYASGSVYAAIYARVMEGAPAPSSWIMAKEIESWATASTGYKFVDLPVDYPYRHLLVRPFKTRTGINAILNEVKLSKNVDAFVFYDVETAEIQRQLQNIYGPYHVNRELYATHGDNLNTYFGDYAYGSVHPVVGNLNPMHIAQEGAVFQLYLYGADSGTPESSDANLHLHLHGWNPENTLLLPIANPGDDNHWVTFLSTDAVRVRFKETSANAAATVAAVQLRSY